MKWKIWIRYKKYFLLMVILFLLLIILLLKIFSINKWLFTIALLLLIIGIHLLKN